MTDRLATITTAHSDTCQWLFEGEEYRDWRDPDALNTNHGFLWLKGKPGAGKSTLIKKAHHHGRQEHGYLIVSFFFNARGVELQNSTQSMFRSVLHQLLNKRMEQLADLLKREGYSPHVGLLGTLLAKVRRRETRFAPLNWPIELLKDMLRDLVLAFNPVRVGRCANTLDLATDVHARGTYRDSVLALAQTHVTFYVDALDECDNHDARDMIEFLGALRASAAQEDVGFRVLLTSRHYPHITFNACHELILDRKDGHEADIAKYIRSNLRIGESKLACEIQATIQVRASGVFLWVVLVTRILNELYDRGQIRRLRQRLDVIPSGLHELFQEILQDNTLDGEDILCVFQWLLFSQKPLSLQVLYHAVTGTCDDVEDCGQNDVNENDMRRFLLDASKGLAEMTKGINPTVQFIHESVRGYLLDVGLVTLDPSLGSDLVGRCHAQLHECCRRYLETALIILTRLLGKAPSEEDDAVERQTLLRKAESACSFLIYAIKGVFCHADSAHTPHLPEVLTSFLYHLWRELYNLAYPKHALSAKASPLYMLILMGASKLAAVFINKQGMPRQSPKGVLTEHHRSFLGPAVANCDRRMATMLLGHGIGANWPAINNHTCLSLAVNSGDAQMVGILIDAGATADPAANDPWGALKLGPSLRRASEEIVLKTLTSAVYTARWHEDFNWILDGMRQKRRPAAEQMLISRLENIVSEVERASDGRTTAAEPFHATALLAACIYDRIDLIVPLARYGVDLDVRHASDKTGLIIATGHFSTKAAQILLEHGADPNVPDGVGNYPVHIAARKGREATMRLLLDHGADVNALDESQERPLAMAAVFQREQGLLQLLIDHGARVNVLDMYGNSALVTAARLGNLGILDMLLEAGNPVPAEQLDKAVLEALHHGQDVVVERLVQKGAKQPLLRPRRKSKVSSSSSSTSEEQTIDQADPDASPSPSQPARSVASAAAAAAPPASILRRPREYLPFD
jgi:ankyrin repeat protein